MTDGDEDDYHQSSDDNLACTVIQRAMLGKIVNAGHSCTMGMAYYSLGIGIIGSAMWPHQIYPRESSQAIPPVIFYFYGSFVYSIHTYLLRDHLWSSITCCIVSVFRHNFQSLRGFT
jgi:hypothetical protein